MYLAMFCRVSSLYFWRLPSNMYRHLHLRLLVSDDFIPPMIDFMGGFLGGFVHIMVIRSVYSPHVAADYGLSCDAPSLTQQHFAAECDINTIIARYRTTGVMVDPLAPRRSVLYGDFTAVPDYQSAQQIVCDAQEAFDSLDSRTRRRFANNPAELLAFLSDEANRDEAISLGLISPPVAEAAPVGGGPDAPATAAV